MPQNFTLHPQLEKDTHLLFDLEYFFVLLHKNSTIPWIIIVPKTKETEVYNLPEIMQHSISRMTKNIAIYFESEFSTTKMNIAAIGNIVSQLHIHIIGRKPSDACWPDVVWGNSYPYKEYSDGQIGNIKKQIESLLITSTNDSPSN